MSNTGSNDLEKRLRDLATDMTRKWEDNPGYFVGHAILDAVFKAADMVAELEREECAARAVVLMGNLSDGFAAVGPYASMADAADAHDGDECWLMTLTAPRARGGK